MDCVGNWFLGFGGDANGCVLFLLFFDLFCQEIFGHGVVRGAEELGFFLKEFEHLMEKQG